MSSSPTKQGEIMAMGIPVVCNAGIGDTDKIVQDYASGILVTEMNQQGYSRAVVQLTQTAFNAKSIRDGALDYFSLEKGKCGQDSVCQ